METFKISNRWVRYLGLGALVCIIAFISTTGVIQNTAIENDLVKFSGQNRILLKDIDSFLSSFVNLQNHFATFVIQEQTDVKPMLLEAKSLVSEAEGLKGRFSDEEHLALIDDLIGTMKKYRVSMVAYSQELQIRRTGDAVRSWEATLLEIDSKIQETGIKLRDIAFERMQSLDEAIILRSRRARDIGLYMGIAGIIFAIMLAVLLQVALATPIKKLIGVSRAAADGDLTRQVTRMSDDEVGELAEAISDMLMGLQTTVREIKNTVVRVAEVAHGVEHYTSEVSNESALQKSVVESANTAVKAMDTLVDDVNSQFSNLAESLDESSSSTMELKSSVEEISGFADGLASEIENVTSSLIEMSVSMKENLTLLESLSSAPQETAQTARNLTTSSEEVGTHAQTSHDLAAKVTEMARKEGAEALQEMIQVTNRNKEIVDGYSAIINSLGERSESIGEIMDVIRAMADQSSLLAINAAIIAAQAGEHGKGFSVVAEEIGTLADTTAASVRNVENVVQSVQKDVDTAVGMINDVIEGADHGIKAAEMAGQVFKNIEDSSSMSADRAKEIAVAAEHQVTRSDEIMQVVTRNLDDVMSIRNAMEEQKTGADHVVASAEKIRETAEMLKQSTEEQAKETGIISQVVSETNEFAGTVKTAMEGEKKAVGEMVTSLGQISDATEKINKSLGALEGLVADLASLADELDPVVSRFKLEEDVKE